MPEGLHAPIGGTDNEAASSQLNLCQGGHALVGRHKPKGAAMQRLGVACDQDDGARLVGGAVGQGERQRLAGAIGPPHGERAG